ncbi:hypothetical protein LOTGIDRAFT_168481 [Lottia gigantea]|uniref:Uncharacterized protein n=1 Tax=Lottia gigantea TaxID=225164 RepID=V3ZK43_LOTGI|nr:hypothetical protein LOTGIDRAFT_168481 [Lottia gigantea]ESO84622.1 hypothetical protein LOTGIDRAFT_168481 [Lottia gigantea]
MTTVIDMNGESKKEYDYRIKIILLGDVNVGKSSFIRVLSEQTDLEQGCCCKDYQQNSYAEVECILNGKRILAKIIDTGGQEKFRSLTASYYRGIHGCFVLFNRNREQTFNNIMSWLDELNSFNHQHLICTMIVGTSASSQEPKISTEKAIKLSEHINGEYAEVFMHKPNEVVKALHGMLDCIVAEIPNTNSLSVSITPKTRKQNKKKVFIECAC